MGILDWCKEHITEIIMAVILLVCVILMGAGFVALFENESNRISEGTVIDKHYSSAYTTVVYTEVGDTKIPHDVYHPESYQLEIQGEKDEETVCYWFECTAEEYQRYSIGDYYRK